MPMPGNIKATGNHPIANPSPLSFSKLGKAARFLGRKIAAIAPPKTYLPNSQTASAQSRPQPATLQNFTTIKASPHQSKARVSPQATHTPKPSQRPVTDEPANLRQLRAENKLLEKLNQLPEPPNHDPAGKGNACPF